MLTYSLMYLLVIGIAFSTLWGIKYDSNKNDFMSIEDTTFLRGFWCIIVVLVHVPELYQNHIQDMLGSFAYIGVTFFFMTSAYGLKWSIEHKTDYMDRFWRRRLPPILFPALIANALLVFAKAINGKTFSALQLVNIDGWVKVLIVHYLIFWLIYKILPKIVKGGYWQDVVLCIFVVTYSLTDYFQLLPYSLGWPVERLGFVYGIIIANHKKQFDLSMREKWLLKTMILMFLSALFGVVYLKIKMIPFWGDYVIRALLGLSMTVFTLQIIRCLKIGNKLNSFLGKRSYEIYLLHGVAFTTLCALGSINSGVFIILGILITIVLAYILNMITNSILHR